MSIHPHQHAVKVISSGESVDEAVRKALEGLLDPQGHHGKLSFHTFEVTKIGGRFDGSEAPIVQVAIEAYASHKDGAAV